MNGLVAVRKCEERKFYQIHNYELKFILITLTDLRKAFNNTRIVISVTFVCMSLEIHNVVKNNYVIDQPFLFLQSFSVNMFKVKLSVTLMLL